MNNLIPIALGGSIGAILRHFISNQMVLRYGRDFPIGTFSVNVIGSFIMGLLGVLLLEKFNASMEIKTFFLVGLLGSFTTFSSFSLDALALMQKEQFLKAFLYMGSSVFASVFACWLGFILAKQWFIH